VDCGTVVNPDTVVAQIESGVIYGVSGALWGEITIKNGRVERSNFSDSRILRMSEGPPIEVHLIRNFEPPGGIGRAADGSLHEVQSSGSTQLRVWPASANTLVLVVAVGADGDNHRGEERTGPRGTVRDESIGLARRCQRRWRSRGVVG
jgi:hypothetical protein